MKNALTMFLVIICLQTVNPARAQTVVGNLAYKGFLLGHNLTATSDMLENKTCSIGLQVVACRVASRTVLGISPWMYLGFRMWGVAVRQLVDEDEAGNRWAIQSTYFETFEHGNNQSWSPYDMRAIWMQGIRTLAIQPWYRLHINADANYYFNDRKPFSLRRPAVNSSRSQINVSSLHQFIASSGWMSLAEIGILDVFRDPMHAHAGLSFGFDGGWYSWHLGTSVSTTLRTLFDPSHGVDYQSELLDGKYSNGQQIGEGYEGHIDPSLADRDYGFHPEFALQATF